MKGILTVLLLTVFICHESIACLNGESKILKDGTLLYVDEDSNVPKGHEFFTGRFEKTLVKLDSLYNESKELDYLSDKGLLLILLKRYDEAINLYLEIEKIDANRYSTASNLGTAYELIGENEKALNWIRKSVEIDPKSHDNSEWIHVNILEAKVKGEEFITTQFLLNTDFGLDTIPKSNMTKEELQNLSKSLYYQLNERISFIKPKNKIVAHLLFDLGNIAFLLENYSVAKGDYRKAKKYGFTNQLLDIRSKEAKRLSHLPKPEMKKSNQSTVETSYNNYPLLLSIAFVIGLMAIVYFKGRAKS